MGFPSWGRASLRLAHNFYTAGTISTFENPILQGNLVKIG